MNYAPSLPYEFGSADQIGVPTFAKITNPQVLHPHIITILQDEEHDFLSLPSEDSLRLLSAPALSKDGKAAYNLLAEMVARDGWEALTILRSRVLERPAQLLRRSKQMVLDGLNSSGSYISRGDKDGEYLQNASEYSEFVSAAPVEEGEVKKEFSESASSDVQTPGGREEYLSPQKQKYNDMLPSATFIPLEPSDDTPCAFKAEDDTYKPETIAKEAAESAPAPEPVKETEKPADDMPRAIPDIQDVTIVHEPGARH